MRMKDMLTTLGVLVMLEISQTMGAIVLTVSPYPARIYQNAPPGTPVLNVTGYDDVTGASMERMYLSPGVNSSCFKVDVTTGILSVNKTVRWSVGTVLTFFVYAGQRSELDFKHVMIIVSVKNRYAPTFSKKSEAFKIYRYASGERIGSVMAIDRDPELYNQVFKYSIPDERADTYLKISSNGDITLKSPPPDSIRELSFPVIAADEGSPRLTGTSMIHIALNNVKHPTVFCFATEVSDITLCWKNPMAGRPEVTGFEVEVTGSTDTTYVVPASVADAEMCDVISDTQIGKLYFFRVSVKTTSGSGGINKMKVMINNTGIGFTPQCLHNDFDACKYLKPCQNNAACRRQDDGALNYQCDCPEGWRGKNCTLQDMCAQAPCQNRGSCNFLGHQQFSCSCVDDFYGIRCQYFNACSILPCQNNGVCSMDTTGRYTCACPDHFTGKNCELKDPCNPTPCTNGGTCSRVSDDEFACACTTGYYGHTCSEMNLCISQQPCKNNGTCEHLGNGTYRCHCTVRFTGIQCLEFDPCSQSPCQNRGTCVLTDTGTYNCECHPGFYGGECQHYDTCHLIDCGSSGTCKETTEGPKCMCDLGYYGDTCEFYNACDGENPCGLRGTCRNISNSDYECDCIDEWYGLQCQYLNSCRLVNCENGGYCENFAFLKKGNFTCKCLNGFYGDTCSFYNPCVSSPCRHGDCTNTTSHEYTCDCNDGYYGKDCDVENPCKERTCENGGTCRNTSDTEFLCLCQSGFVGTHCNLTDPCETPCANFGTCTVDPTSFVKVCQCPDKYTGVNCDAVIPDCDITPCQHGGTCVGSTGSCACSSNYTGSLCETRVTACTSNPCSADRRCVEVDDGYTCVCRNGADNDDCIEVCPEEMTYDRTGRYNWPLTKRGLKIHVLCDAQDSINQPKMATRQCLALASNTARWSEVDSSQCPEYGLLAAGETLNELKSLTSNPSQIGADQLANFTNILEKVFSYSLLNAEIADSMTSVVSNLADVNVSVSIECDNKNKTSQRLVQLLETYSASTNNTEPIMSANVNVRAMDLSPDDSNVVTFRPQLLDGNHTVESGLSITLPPEAIEAASSMGRRPVRVQFIGYRKSMFFIPSDRFPEGLDDQRVVTTIVKGVVVKNLSAPIIYKMRNIEAGRNHSCVYWDPENRTWSYDGVTTLMLDDNTTECHTNHLTSFAILMDPNPAHPSPVIHEQILTYISYVGCAISLIGLILTILTYGLFRCMNKDKSGKILLNLCASMLLMNVAFLMGAQSSTTYGEQLCMGVAVLLHYFLLTTLMWMLVEAVEMYQALVTVFAKYARFYMIKRCVVAWGVPVVIVVITLSVDLNNYRPAYDFCFISQANKVAYYVSLVGPGCLIVLVNTIVFIMVARVILKPRFQQQQREDKEHVTPAQVRGAFTVMILLGVTWVFGPIAVNEARVVFNYLFCILNSLQGFFIFVFRCLYNPEARLAWIQLIKTGTLKTRRGPIKSVYSETSSKGDHSKSRTNVHFGGTLKSNVMQSNGWHHPKLNGLQSENGSVRNDNQYFGDDKNSEDQVFHTKDYVYLDNNTPPTRTSDMCEDGFTHL
ncbi:uncharacterized protein [Haliotis cracherodii]|uniref:uncharacterized protein n=1 Tax=Haliotis cracherodii TaxID=6455 RepID=UPI0039EC1AFB